MKKAIYIERYVRQRLHIKTAKKVNLGRRKHLYIKYIELGYFQNKKFENNYIIYSRAISSNLYKNCDVSE